MPTTSNVLRERTRAILDLLLPLAREWVESPEALGTSAAMAVAFFIPTAEGWRERVDTLDVEQATAVVSTANELLAWALDEEDSRSAEELAADVVSRLVGAGVIVLDATAVESLAAGSDASAISGPGLRDGHL